MASLPPGRRLCAIIIFSKLGRMRFLSHLDLARTLDRAVRRAKLPVAYSKGFHPHAEISFGPPLPLGAEGLREPACLHLERVAPPAQMARDLGRELPGGLDLVSLELGDRGRRSPLADLEWAGWEFALVGLNQPEALERAIERFMAASAWPIFRETKSKMTSADLRAGVRELALHRPEGLLIAELSLRPDTLAKPEELLRVLVELAGQNLSIQRQVRTYLR